MERGALQAPFHGVAKSQIQLTSTFDSLASLNLNFLIHKMGMITSLLPVPELSRGLNVLEYIIYRKVEYKYIEY